MSGLGRPLSAVQKVEMVLIGRYPCCHVSSDVCTLQSGCNYVTKHVTKHFRVEKKYCAQQQLKGIRCLTHNLCAIFIGFTQHDNCAIAMLKFQAALVSEFIVQPTTLFATQTWKITEISKNKQRDVQLIYGRDVTCNCSIGIVFTLFCVSNYCTHSFPHTHPYIHFMLSTLQPQCVAGDTLDLAPPANSTGTSAQECRERARPRAVVEPREVPREEEGHQGHQVGD